MPEQKTLPNTLSDGAARLLLQGVRTTGSYDKDDVMPYIERMSAAFYESILRMTR